MRGRSLLLVRLLKTAPPRTRPHPGRRGGYNWRQSSEFRVYSSKTTANRLRDREIQCVSEQGPAIPARTWGTCSRRGRARTRPSGSVVGEGGPSVAPGPGGGARREGSHEPGSRRGHKVVCRKRRLITCLIVYRLRRRIAFAHVLSPPSLTPTPSTPRT